MWFNIFMSHIRGSGRALSLCIPLLLLGGSDYIRQRQRFCFASLKQRIKFVHANRCSGPSGPQSVAGSAAPAPTLHSKRRAWSGVPSRWLKQQQLLLSSRDAAAKLSCISLTRLSWAWHQDGIATSCEFIRPVRISLCCVGQDGAPEWSNPHTFVTTSSAVHKPALYSRLLGFSQIKQC